jgi:hypothetical protein
VHAGYLRAARKRTASGVLARKKFGGSRNAGEIEVQQPSSRRIFLNFTHQQWMNAPHLFIIIRFAE